MHILIDNKSGEPIYNQIYSQIKNQIISGELNEDEMLPSIRWLAKDLRISFITTKRAYEELEKEGFIYTLRRPRRSPRPPFLRRGPPGPGGSHGSAEQRLSPLFGVGA